jgi:hypothetical protein
MTGALHERLRGYALLVSFLALVSLHDAAHAKSMPQQNLKELLTHTDSIVVGTVAAKSDGFQDGLPYTEITIDVRQSIKGKHGRKYTFRQFGLIAPKPTGDGRVNLMVTPEGWPTFAVGEQVMLFLHKRASLTGFQTTAGLSEGKFTIRGDRIANATDNAALFQGVRIQGPVNPTFKDLVNQPSGAYALDTFLSLVRTAVKENWIETGVLIDGK